LVPPPDDATLAALAASAPSKVPAIHKHLKNISDSGELVEAAVIRIEHRSARRARGGGQS
jgi:hypothetical protein